MDEFTHETIAILRQLATEIEEKRLDVIAVNFDRVRLQDKFGVKRSTFSIQLESKYA